MAEKNLPAYTVLMSVYYRENASFLKAAVDSMRQQTVAPSQFVLVCDGPLGEALNEVVQAYEKAEPVRFTVVRLPENKGLANALNEGLKHCRNEFVARMDSDDIAAPNRMELQLTAMQQQQIVLCGTAVEEFDADPAQVQTEKSLPLEHTEILTYAKRRNPFNHPSVVYRKSWVEKVGGYEDYPLFEDYQLWIKMLLSGAKSCNLKQCLLKMRTGAGLYERRGGMCYFQYTRKMEKYKRSVGLVRAGSSFSNLCVRFVFCIMPAGLRAKLYERLLRQKN